MKARVLGVLAFAWLGRAEAAPLQEVFVSPAQGLQMLGVWFAPDGTAYARTCTGIPCSKDTFGAVTLATKVTNGTLEVVNIGEGKRVVHVKAKAADGSDWEAIVAGKPDGQVIFSGKTGFAAGQDGERTGQMVRIYEDLNKSVVEVSEIREDLRICGQPMTPLVPKVLDPKTLELRGATVPRLSREQRANATPIVATSSKGNPPIGKLFTALGASSAIGTPQALVDGDPATSWAEARPGDGHGEFVSLAVPSEVPIAKLSIVGAKGQAPPRKFYLVTPETTFAVTILSAMQPGESYDIPFAAPIKTSCMALVLEEAYVTQPKPDVGIADLQAYSELEQGGATAEDIAKTLGGSGARTDAAAGVLKRAGDAGAKAVLAAYASLEPAGRARAIEVASSMPCDVGAQVLIAALGDKERQLAMKAEKRFFTCKKDAASALIATLGGADLDARARVAPILAMAAPALAYEPLARVMGEGSPAVRAKVRDAFARSVRSAPKEKLASLLGDGARAPAARLDLLRASTERLAEVPSEAKMALDASLSNADFATRYLALEPLAALAKTDAGLQARLVDAIAKDESWPVRARAAEVLATVPGAQGAILAATADPEPRVREAAIKAVGDAKLAGGTIPAAKLLDGDPWTFVRVASATTLAAFPAAPDVDEALADAAKKDTVYKVRSAAISALGVHRARAHSSQVVASLENKEEHPDVRMAAAHALGDMCDPKSLDALTSAARMSVSPVASLEDLTIATAAIRALSAIHPKDLRSRLEPLLGGEARAEMKRAAESAISDKGTCP